jgi:hypothetical protein
MKPVADHEEQSAETHQCEGDGGGTRPEVQRRLLGRLANGESPTH